MKYSIASALAVACLASALPQQGPPVSPPTTTTPPSTPPTSSPGGGGGGPPVTPPSGPRGRFNLIVEAPDWAGPTGMDGRWLKLELDSSRSGFSWLTVNVTGDTQPTRYTWEQLPTNTNFGHIALTQGRGGGGGGHGGQPGPEQWSGFLASDRGRGPRGQPTTPVTFADSNTATTTITWLDDSTWSDDGHWQRQPAPRDPRTPQDPPDDKWALCWIKIPDPVTSRPNDRLAVHWHNGRQPLDTSICWPIRIRYDTGRFGP